tara:strand:- start:2363 stop:3349 length:987 start_codon:yes stop_codon:yes gene_type:complete
MKFVKAEHIVVFGGSQLALEFLKSLQKKKIAFHYFTNRRQLNDYLINNLSLKNNLIKNKIKFNQTEDINKNKLIKKIFTKKSLGIGIGLPWQFKEKLLKLMNPNLVDVMGIPMPLYRGGAHYTWMILNNNRLGGCVLQNIDKNTFQGNKDTNKYFLKKEYTYPKKLINPKDYFVYSSKIEAKFLIQFLNKVKKNKSFHLRELSKKNSTLFPRLMGKINSYINWDLDVDELVRFINAFSDPYPGAQTFLGNNKVILKNAKIFKKNNFHSYSSGIITNFLENKVFICAKGGILNATCEFLEDKKKLKINIGERFITKISYLEKAKTHKKF